MKKNNNDRVFVNKDIRAKEVQCIDQNNKNLGVINTKEAIKLAEQVGLDLVLISSFGKDKAPICKILDSGKYKYDLSKKNKEIAKKRRESVVKTKEISFRYTTDLNDLKTKARQADKFLDNGHRIKIKIIFKGREKSYQDLGLERINEFIALLKNAEIFEPLQTNGDAMMCTIAPKKV